MGSRVKLAPLQKRAHNPLTGNALKDNTESIQSVCTAGEGWRWWCVCAYVEGAGSGMCCNSPARGKRKSKREQQLHSCGARGPALSPEPQSRRATTSWTRLLSPCPTLTSSSFPQTCSPSSVPVLARGSHPPSHHARILDGA